MNLLKLQIEGFGQLQQRSFELGSKVNVFFGPNEAGKTTLLAFIRTMLLGFPRTWRNHYVPKNGGSHGGSVLFKDRRGAVFTLRREAGASGGCLTVYEGTTEVRDPDSVLGGLTGHVSAETFASIFAFGLEELYDLKLLQNEEVSARVYSAGLGVKSLPQSLEAICKARDDIFTRGSRAKRILEIQKRLDEVGREIAGCAVLAKRFGQDSEDLRKIDSDLAEIERNQLDMQSRIARIDLLLQVWPVWSELGDIDRHLSTLPFRSLPERALEQLAGFENRFDRASELLTNLEAQRAHLILQQMDERYEGLLKDGQAIDGIRRRRAAFDTALRDLDKGREALERDEEQLQNLLATLGPDWSEKRVRAFELSTGQRAEMDACREAYGRCLLATESSKREVDRSQAAATDVQGTLTDLHRQHSEMIQPGFTDEELKSRRARLRQARRIYDERQRANDRRGVLDLQFRQILVTGVAAVLLLVMTFLLNGPGRWLALLSALAFASVAISLAVRSRNPKGFDISVSNDQKLKKSLLEEIKTLRSTEGRLADELQTIAAEFAVPTIDDGTLAACEDEIESQASVLRVWSDFGARIREGTKELDRWKSVRDVAARTHSDRQEKLNAGIERWKGWLRSLGFNTELTFEECTWLLDRIDKAQDQLRQLDIYRQRVARMQEEVDGFTREVIELADRHSLEVPIELGAAADALIEECEKATRARVTSAANAEQIATLNRQIEQKCREIDAETARLRQFLVGVGASDPAELRRFVKEEEERIRLAGRKGELEQQISGFAGSDAGELLLRWELESTTREELLEQKRKFESDAMTASGTRDQLRDRKAKVESEMAALQERDRTTELLSEQQVLLEELKSWARKWAVLSIANSLLDRTKSRYEKERKPEVIANAEVFFDKVTGGRYPHISAPTDSREIEVVMNDGTIKSPEILSRGTVEQLYLALRFGLVTQFAKQEVALPVVVDEILVNFDPRRARQVAEAFIALSQTNQVLLFTCHPWVVDLFQNPARPEVKVIEIEAP